MDLGSFGKIKRDLTLISAFGLLTELFSIIYLAILRLGLSPLQIAYYIAVVILVGVVSSRVVLIRRRPSEDEGDLRVRFNVTISGESAK